MVICYYFQKGNCHYGSQCRNEHSTNHNNRSGIKPNDIRAVITAEAEAALTGKQWILSCFAPFRDKLGLIIPEFTEDVSPEEMRWECYQAKSQGVLSQYTNTVSTKVQEATQKMQMLLSPSPEVITFLMELHNEAVNPSTKNPFSSGQKAFGTSNSTNIFSQAANPVQTNVFGGAPSNPFNSNNFVQTNTNIFNTQSQAANNNVFASNNSNIFQPNTFANSANNMNGNPAPTNIFAKAASDFGQTSVSGTPPMNIFSFAQPGTNIFGGNASANTVFSQPNTIPSFGQPTNLSTNIFAMANAAPANNTNEQGAVFGQPTSLNGNIFAVANTTTSNIFGNVTQDTGSFVPSIAPSDNKENVFGMQSNANVFKNDAQNNAVSVLQPQQNSAGNPFLNEVEEPFTGFVFKGIDENAYSKLEELTAEEIDAYEADEFTFGNIPVEPPTRDMCFD